MSREEVFYRRAAAANNHIQLVIAELLKLLSLEHCHVPNVVHPGEALSHILDQEFPNEKSRRKLVEVLERLKIFQSSTSPLLFQPQIDIVSLDVPLIEKLLKKVTRFALSSGTACQTTSNKQVCCGNCYHPCPICGQIECDPRCANKHNNIWDHPCENPRCQERKSECINANCAGCINQPENEQCGVSNAIKGIDVVKKNRNTTFHLTLSEIAEFLDRGKLLQNFPYCHNPQQLFEYLEKSCVVIINFLCNKTFFQENAITFEVRRQRIDKIKEILYGEQNSTSALLVLLDNISRHSIFLSEENNYLQNRLQTVERNERINLQRYGNTGCELLIEDIKVTEILELEIFAVDDRKRITAIIEDNYDIRESDHSSIICITHDLVNNSKYCYEIVFKDNMDRKWESVYNLDPGNCDVLKIKDEEDDFLFLSPHSVEMEKYEIDLQEKIPRGFKSILHIEGEYSVTKFVEFKHSKSHEWRRLTTFTTQPQEDNRCTFECTFDECDVYDVRCLVETKDGRYHLFTMDEITIVGKEVFDHQRIIENNLLMLHPIGDNNDAFETLKKISEGDVVGERSCRMINVPIVQAGGGHVSKNIANMDDYIDQNFKDQPYICFPPLYLVKNLKEIASKFDKYIRKNEGRFIMLSSVDLRKDLRTLGYSSQQIHKLFGDDLKLNSVCNILFDMEKATVYVTTPCANVKHLKNAYQQSDRNIKALLIITQSLHDKSPVRFVGIIGCFNSTKEEIENSNSFCKKCSYLTITSNDCESSQALTNWFTRVNKEIKRYGKSYFNDKRTDSMKLTANRLMILAAIEDYSLPATCVATDEEKLERLVLTSAQINAVFDEENKRKVIKGNFGSGKTLVMKKTLEYLIATKQRDDIIYYINWDPYSLINAEMSNSPTPTNVIFTNVCQISEDAKSHEVISLSRCFQHIAERHNDKTVHILIDELDEDELDANEISKLKTTLKSASFNGATISISVQSVGKHRKWDHLTIEQWFWKECEMEVYTLPSTLRFTNKINNFVAEMQSLVSSTTNIYYTRSNIQPSPKQPFQPSPKQPSFLASIFKRVSGRKNNRAPVTESFLSEDSNSKDEIPTSVSDQNGLAPTENIDKLAKQANESKPTDGNFLSVETRLIFMECQSGHLIRGETPQILRLNVEYADANVLRNFIKDYCLRQHPKSLVVCNDLQLMLTLVAVFIQFKIPIFKYYHDLLRSIPASVVDQKKAYEELMREDESILLFLTDNRGCRGLEYKNVVCIIDERHEFERGALVEILCRATAQLSIISFQDSKQSTHISKIIDTLTTKGDLEDVTEQCTTKTTDGHPKWISLSNDPLTKETRKQSQQNLEKFVVCGKVDSSLTVDDYTKEWTFNELDQLLQTKQFNKLQQLLELRPQLSKLRSDDDNVYDRENLLHCASRYGVDIDIVEMLIRSGVSMEERNDVDGWLPIHFAALNNRVHLVEHYVKLNKRHINQVDNVNETPLHIAALNDSEETVKFLLTQSEVDVNVKNRDGKMADDHAWTDDHIKQLIRNHRKENKQTTR